MRKDCFKRAHQFKEALLQREEQKEREREALLECKKVMLNYTIHELNRTVLIKKRARPAVLQMAQFKGTPPETGTGHTSLRCRSDRWVLQGSGAPSSGAHVCTVTARPQLNASSAERQQVAGCSPHMGKYLTPFLLSPFSPHTNPPSHQHYLQTMLQKPAFCISFLLFLSFFV